MNQYLGILGAKYLGIRRPLFVSWMITDRCNLHCPGCSRNDGPLGHAQAAVVERLFSNTVPGMKVNLTGGEPLIHPMIGDIVDGLKKRGARVTMNTNGLLAVKMKDILSKLDRVSISLDGRRNTHDKTHGDGAWDAAVKAMEMLRTLGTPFRMICTLCADTNRDDVDGILNLSESLGTTAIFQPGQTFALGSCRKNPEAPEPAKCVELLRHIAARKAAHPHIVMNSAAGLAHLMKWPGDTVIPCGAGRFFCRIDPAGAVFSCSNCTTKTPSIGSIMEDDLKAILMKAGPVSCAQCWCGDRVEANLIYNFNLAALLNFMQTGRRIRKSSKSDKSNR